MRPGIRLAAGLLCLTAGAAMTGTAAWRWWSARAAEHSLRLELGAPAAAAPAAEPAAAPAAAAEPVDPAAARTAAGSPAQGEALFRLAVPRLGVEQVVVYGSSDAALDRGPGLIERTAPPGGPGNTVVAAHRDYWFWWLDDLEPGDRIHVHAGDGEWHYTVRDKRIIRPEQTEVLDPTPEPTLTLITCWPILYVGSAPERLVLTATLLAP